MPSNYGWTVEKMHFDWPTLRDAVLKDVDRLNDAYTTTLENNKVERFLERATITGPHGVRLASGQDISAKYILVATGAWPVMPEFEGNEHCITSNEVFHLPELPRRIVIQGAGYIALEFAGIFNALGSAVTVVNRSDAILRGMTRRCAIACCRSPWRAASPIVSTARSPRWKSRRTAACTCG
jgi:glutathione reductase (NADPH)